MTGFMFATGIENSYPVVRFPDGRVQRVDEMAKTRHYARWREDFQLTKALGIPYLRYGPPYHLTHTAPGRYDWAFADETFGALRSLGVTPIVDLCHFGVPDWAGSFQNPEWPALFAEYAGAFARRFPWVTCYTPVNEVFIAALFSAQLGWWNERHTDELSFVTALKHLSRANLLAMQAIAGEVAAPLFIQSESSEYFHAEDPECLPAADFLNEKRFLSLDLAYGRALSPPMQIFLTEHGMTRDDLRWFREQGSRGRASCVLGTDYYETNEHVVHADGSCTPSGELFGYYVLAREYYDRYRLPLMHTETNHAEPTAVSWLRKQWRTMMRLRQDGVPVVGFTWYSLIDQVDWDSALREDAGRVNATGLCDLDRRIRPVGAEYKRLIAQWRTMLPRDIVPAATRAIEWGAAGRGGVERRTPLSLLRVSSSWARSA